MSSEPVSSGPLTIESLNLSDDELRTYPRWYTDLLLRKQARSLSPQDVFSYMENFGIRQKEKTLVSYGAILVQPICTCDNSVY